MKSLAVLLVNLGSPASTDPADLRRYLDQFLMDPYVIDVPLPLRALIVKGFILPTRPAKSAEAYAKIWTDEGSPLVAISRHTRAALEAKMGVPVGLAMRYGEPSIERGIAELVARCPQDTEYVVVPMYPQYAMATTKTVEVQVEAAMKARGLRRRYVDAWFADPGYLDACAALIRSALPADTQHLLFSYHGIPERHVRKTDPTGVHCLRSVDCCQVSSPAHATCYRHQIVATTNALARRLNLPPDAYSYAFQSRLGGGWLTPFTDKVLLDFPGRGITRLAVVCPSFIADCLETLEEIDIRGRASFLEAGGESFAYIPCLNDDPAWIDALATLCKNAAAVAS
jgi:protoporphyrin/coproporphyrin ferrochelatase